MKEEAMNEMLRSVRYLRSRRHSVVEINNRMRSALDAYKNGNYYLAIQRATAEL